MISAIATLVGGALGGALRLAPEFLKWLDRKNERSHELAMQDKALEFEKFRSASKMGEIQAYAQANWNEGALSALTASVTAQGKMSGVKWVDALNVSVRPVITYSFMLLYSGIKITTFFAALNAGADWLQAINLMWTPDDQVIWAGMLNFWFLGRVFDKAGR